MNRGGPLTGPPRFRVCRARTSTSRQKSTDRGPAVPPIQDADDVAEATRMHPPVLRRLLGPLGAMLAIAAVAGYLVTTQPPTPAAVDLAPSPIASLAPVAATLGGVSAERQRTSTPTAATP